MDPQLEFAFDKARIQLRMTQNNMKRNINSILEKTNSLLCVGLDPVVEKIPEHLRENPDVLFVFNKTIIDATAKYTCAFKPNSAFYEAYGTEGIRQLKLTCDYIRNNHPDHFLILDAKRADIGSTNQGYVKFAFDWLGADAITLHPYLGYEALKPFLDREDKTSIVLCRTSNRGAGEFQDLQSGGKPFYQRVAKNVYSKWNKNNNCMLVVGATYPNELAEVRRIVGEMTILVPGIGAQGGDLEKTLKAGLNKQKSGLIISASRSILYASSGNDIFEAAAREASLLCSKINGSLH